MGIAMASNLQKHLTKTTSTTLRYYNRTASRGDSLRDLGATPSATIADVAAKADIIFMSLSDDSAVEDVISSLIGTGGTSQLSGKLVVDTSTVHPKTTAKVKGLLDEAGASFVAAPVFGASPVAALGQLLVILAGPSDAIAAIAPFLVGVLARDSVYLGDDVTKSSLLKTAG